MSHWNYRVVKTVTDGVPMWGLFEVYYNENNQPVARTEEPTDFVSEEGPDELIDSLNRALATLQDLGVLDDEDIGGEW